AMRGLFPSGDGIAVATSAVRDARNGAGFLARCGEILGARPVLLSGREEASLCFRGAVSDLAPGLRVCHIDVGGGSTEVSAGAVGEPPTLAASVNVGCVRMAERHGLLDRAAEADLRRAEEEIAALLEPALHRLLERGQKMTRAEAQSPQRKAKTGETEPEPPRQTTGRQALPVIASGGSATTFAAIRQALGEYSRERVHGYRTSLEEMTETLRALTGMTAAERARLPGMMPGREGVLPAGLLILCVFLRLVGSSRMRVSTRGLRYGLVQALAAGDRTATWSW
ncbi:MAG: hypothetical protein JXR77_01585, partial [Lentisphaeria bacterium]|nr:hypothetical protein [Lentisphaeria bacterium]